MNVPSASLVVGVDGSPGSHRALLWAAAEAARRGSPLVAVTAWTWDGIEQFPLAPATRDEARAHAEQGQEAELAPVLAEHPDLQVRREVVEGDAAEALTRLAADAALLVLGSHGHSHLRHALLGSVSERCVRHAPCPVVIVPAPAAARPPKPRGGDANLVAPLL